MFKQCKSAKGSSELKKKIQEVRNCRLLIEMRKRHNAEPSQYITKFKADDRQYS